MRLTPRLVSAAAIAVMVLAGGAVLPASAQSGRARGNVRVFAHVGAPGEPSLTLVTPNRNVFVGTFEDVEGSDTNPSKVFKYDANGRLRNSYTIHGQTPGAAHGVQVAERDRRGRLYILDQKPSRVILLNPRTGNQRNYATFADIPTCAAAKRSSNCSNTTMDGAPEPDYAAWLPDGSLIVTDYSQQVLWRVPPHGGRARVWLNDKILNGELFGPAGIVLMPSHKSLLVTVATGGLTAVSPNDDPARGRLYRIRLRPHDRPGRLRLLWSSAVSQAPDGFAVSKDRRRVYIAMAGPTANCVVEVAHRKTGWRTAAQFPKTPDGVGSSPVVWDTATSVQFLGRRILVTNQAYFTGISSHWVIFDVATGERGLTLFVPKEAGPAFSRRAR